MEQSVCYWKIINHTEIKIEGSNSEGDASHDFFADFFDFLVPEMWNQQYNGFSQTGSSSNEMKLNLRNSLNRQRIYPNEFACEMWERTSQWIACRTDHMRRETWPGHRRLEIKDILIVYLHKSGAQLKYNKMDIFNPKNFLFPLASNKCIILHNQQQGTTN